MRDVDERGVKVGIEVVYAGHHARDGANEERMGDETKIPLLYSKFKTTVGLNRTPLRAPWY
jgi:hypothetical protein